MRKAFNFFNSYWQISKELSDKDRLAFYDALLHCEFTGDFSKLENLTGMAKFAYISQKHSIESQVSGYLDAGKRWNTSKLDCTISEPTMGGNIAPTVGGNVAPTVQEQVQEQEKDKSIAEKERLFEKFWGFYKKGSKKDTKIGFMKLSFEDIEKIKIHLPLYFKSRPEVKYRKDAERYISKRLFDNGDIEELKSAISQELPPNWMYVKLTPEQWALLTPKQRSDKQNEDVRKAMQI